MPLLPSRPPATPLGLGRGIAVQLRLRGDLGMWLVNGTGFRLLGRGRLVRCRLLVTCVEIMSGSRIDGVGLSLHLFRGSQGLLRDWFVSGWRFRHVVSGALRLFAQLWGCGDILLRAPASPGPSPTFATSTPFGFRPLFGGLVRLAWLGRNDVGMVGFDGS